MDFGFVGNTGGFSVYRNHISDAVYEPKDQRKGHKMAKLDIQMCPETGILSIMNEQDAKSLRPFAQLNEHTRFLF